MTLDKNKYLNFGLAIFLISSIGCGGSSETLESNTLLPIIPQKTKNLVVEVINGYKNINGSYFYFPIPIKIKNYLIGIQNKLKQNSDVLNNINWCAEDYFHITITAPNNMSALEAQQISNELKIVLANQSPIKIGLDPIPKVWPTVIVTTIKNTPELTEFHEKILSVVKKYMPNFKQSNFTYAPHITLGHFKKNISAQFKANLSDDIPDLIKGMSNKNNTWLVNEFELGNTVQPRTSSKAFIKYFFKE